MTEVPAIRLRGIVAGTYAALAGGFETSAQAELTLTYGGILGDSHSGLTRLSGAREPWYPRGTPMRNERQVSILSVEELSEVAAALRIETLEPEWIGGNLLLSGIPHLSLLPPRTLLMFPSGAAIRVDGDNGPCRKSGRGIASHVENRRDIEFGFVKAAEHRRGLVGWVEREGVIRPGDAVEVRTWRQTLYPGQ